MIIISTLVFDIYVAWNKVSRNNWRFVIITLLNKNWFYLESISRYEKDYEKDLFWYLNIAKLYIVSNIVQYEN